MEQRVGSLYYDGQLDDVNCAKVELDYAQVRWLWWSNNGSGRTIVVAMGALEER